MQSYHIHIKGLVQGVGFRPFVAQLAQKIDLCGWVANSCDGVHIEVTGSDHDLKQFQRALVHQAPPRSIITEMRVRKIETTVYEKFTIKTSGPANQKPDLLPAPDMALCPSCRNELMRQSNKRYHYPFITCVHCGPRYSIIQQLPYDRYATTMATLQPCNDCEEEYLSSANRRYHSQTNSCAHCAIPMHLFDADGIAISSDPEEIIKSVQLALCYGSIVAIKGIGGYLLLADATNEAVIKLLRDRKHRPAKPFAVLYDSAEDAMEDVLMSTGEKAMLEGPESPIVLCIKRKHLRSDICDEQVAPGLHRLGVMLPYTGLLKLITSTVKRPLLATSANLSGAPLIYKDEEALRELGAFADLILTYDRDIVTPQDDSVVQFTTGGKLIFLRRSRGFAPNLFPDPLPPSNRCLMGIGADMKNAFALKDDRHLFVSQFLGDQQSLEAQQCFNDTFAHLTALLKMQPDTIIADKHPGYTSTGRAREIAAETQGKFIQVQHHKAHFASVLAEHKLLESASPVLGIIWDGTGWGEDEQIWGGEFFTYEEKKMDRWMHWSYFPQILGDKMSREPRLSALSLMHVAQADTALLQNYFEPAEWQFYTQWLCREASLMNCSVGRLLDGISCFVTNCSYNLYEGEAAMKLEALAMSDSSADRSFYEIEIRDQELNWHPMVKAVIRDKMNGISAGQIAVRVWNSLAQVIKKVAEISGIQRIAFSGGVFQNAFLVQLITDLMGDHFELFFQEKCSPNDEGIALGQIAYELFNIDRDLEFQDSIPAYSIEKISE